jgi:hypothetical protein
MQIIVSHYTWNYNISNHKSSILVNDKNLGNAKKGKVPPIRLQDPS